MPTAARVTRPDPHGDRYLILSTAYVTRAWRGPAVVEPYYEIIAAASHDAPRIVVHTRDESLIAAALRVEGSDERIPIPRGAWFSRRTLWEY